MTVRSSDSPISVIFDLGGVLSHVDERGPATRLAQLAGCNEDEAFEAVFAPNRKAPMETGRQTWEQFAAEVSASLRVPGAEPQLRSIYLSALTPNHGIFPLVQAILEDYPVGLCSNTSSIHWESIRPNLPFVVKLDPVILSYEVGVMKPDHRIYETLVTRADVEPRRVLLIDDSEVNVAGARDAGLMSLKFTDIDNLVADLTRFDIRV